MSLDIWEKTEGQRRVDHPNFKDVHETTFAKGRIIEFEREEDEYRLKIKSRVKVRINDNDSDDFIPILWRPQDQYWDDESVLAKDFDEDSQHYKKAWMSFNGRDDVVVMCKKGVPVAVLGFYDNCPRVGENIVKIAYTASAYVPESATPSMAHTGDRIIHLIMWPQQEELVTDEEVQEHQYGEVNDDVVGPDNADLGLLQECERAGEWSYEHDRGIVRADPEGEECPNAFVHSYFAWIHNIDTYYVIDFIVPIGGVLYIFSFVILFSEVEGIWCAGEDGPQPWYAESEQVIGVNVFAAPYTEENYNKAKAGPTSLGDPDDSVTNEYDGFELQFIPIWRVLSGTRRDQEEPYRLMYNVDHESLKLYVRPHTKEELEAAALWPDFPE